MDVVDHVVQRLDLIGISIESTTWLPEPVTLSLSFANGNLAQPFRRMFLEISNCFSSDGFFNLSNDRPQF